MYLPPVPQHLTDDDVLAALDQIPPDYRAAVLLADVEEFSYREIASVLGLRLDLTVFASAWDAGTEANDELCAAIPGPPPVCTGEGYSSSREGAEGFVHVHNGIHGIGDLMAPIWDWRNLVAKIVIQRLDEG